MQQRIGRIEQCSEPVRSFQPTMVSGLVQTLDYARAMMSGRLSGQRLEQLVQSRQDRRAILNSDRRAVLLHTESALRWHIGSPENRCSAVARDRSGNNARHGEATTGVLESYLGVASAAARAVVCGGGGGCGVPGGRRGHGHGVLHCS